MDLCDLKRGERALVKKVELPDAVSSRLRAMGIFCGARVLLLKVSPLKRTYLVQANGGKAAIGREAARGVKVWRI